MIQEKLTNFKKYNVYRCNNSGIMFACRDYFTVGTEECPDEYSLATHNDCLEYAKKLNRDVIE